MQVNFYVNYVPCTWFDEDKGRHYVHQPGWGEVEFGTEVFCDEYGWIIFGQSNNFELHFHKI